MVRIRSKYSITYSPSFMWRIQTPSEKLTIVHAWLVLYLDISASSSPICSLLYPCWELSIGLNDLMLKTDSSLLSNRLTSNLQCSSSMIYENKTFCCCRNPVLHQVPIGLWAQEVLHKHRAIIIVLIKSWYCWLYKWTLCPHTSISSHIEDCCFYLRGPVMELWYQMLNTEELKKR